MNAWCRKSGVVRQMRRFAAFFARFANGMLLAHLRRGGMCGSVSSYQRVCWTAVATDRKLEAATAEVSA